MAFKDKAPALQNMLNNMALGMYSMTVSEALDEGICVSCKLPVNTNDAEWNISALCPTCFDNCLFLGEDE